MEKIFGKRGPSKRFCFCFSRKLTPAETRYSIFKLELVGVVAGLQAARDILLFRPVILFIDSKSLMYIRLCRNASEQIARLSVQLSSFEVELYHVPSDLNLADNYTRLRGDNSDSQEGAPLRSLTEKESHEIVSQLTIPTNFFIPSHLLQRLLNQDGVLVDLPGKKKKRGAECKEIPRKVTCPSIIGPKRVKDFMVEVKENRNHHTCNMAQETDGEGEVSDGEADFHGWGQLDANGSPPQDMVREEEELGQENPKRGWP